MQSLLLGHQRAIERILVTALLLSHVLDESLTRSRDKKGQASQRQLIVHHFLLPIRLVHLLGVLSRRVGQLGTADHSCDLFRSLLA